MSDSGLISQAEYARRRGVSRQAVAKAVKSGRIPAVNGMIDPAEADRAWAGTTDLARRVAEPMPEVPPAPDAPRDRRTAEPEPKGKVTPAQQQYLSSRAVRESYTALTAKLEYEEQLGKLVRAEDVRAAAFNAGRKARSVWETLPASISDMLVGRDAESIRKLLAEEIARVCAEVDKWAQSPI